VAFFASFVTANRDLFFDAEESLFEFETQVFAQIGAALDTSATASSPSEHVAEAEELAEDVAEVLEDAGIESHALGGGAAKSGMAVAVVYGTLFGIGEDRISFADLFGLRSG